jgi:hypothetical protein
VLECEKLYEGTHCHGGTLHRMLAFHAFCSEWPAYAGFFLCVSQNTSDVVVVSCCMNSTISTHFLSQKTAATTLLAGRQRLFILLRLVWWMCVHPLLWLLFGFDIHKWNPGFITCY